VAIPGNLLSLVTETVDPNTSGWTAMLNATISLGTGGRAGDGTLAIKSVAAGEMRARTVSSYLVAEGTVYAAFADASGATVPERIGIRWLTATGTELSITWSLSTLTATSSWHRIAVAGPAPAGAVRAQVVISSTPAAAAVVTAVENVYLGLPIRTTGNLLDYNTESLEVDASGWAVDANCSIVRQVPALVFPVGYYLGGGHMLAATVTASGNASVKTAAAVSALPGVEYIAFGYLQPPTTAAACWIEMRFVNDLGTVLGTVRSVLAPATTGSQRQIASGTSPAGTTGVVVASGITGGTAGQVWRTDSVVVADAVTAAATGLLGSRPDGTVTPFADAEFEQGVGSWAVTAGAATVARSTPWAAHALTNSYSLALTATTTAAITLASGHWPVHDLGDPSLSWQVKYALRGVAAGWQITDHITWYNAGGAVLSTTNGGAWTLPDATQWWDSTVPHPSPAGAVTAVLSLTLVAPAAGAVLYMDRVSLAPALPINTKTVNAESASVTLTLRGLTVGWLLSVWRVDAAGHRSLVRGPAGLLDGYALTTSTVIVTDYEAPLGVTYSYYAEARDSTGALMETAVWDGVLIPAPDVNSLWLKDPGNPTRNLLLMMPADGGPDWQYPMDTAQYVVKGRRNKVTLHGVRNGGEGDLSVWTRSDQERAALDLLLSSGNDLLLQAAPETGLDCSYVSVGQPSKARAGQDSTDTWRTWTLPLVEADMPTAVGVASPGGRTWQDILSEFATWADVRDTYATWEDVLFDRRKTS
jgi:hypothetical protein